MKSVNRYHRMSLCLVHIREETAGESVLKPCDLKHYIWNVKEQLQSDLCLSLC